MTFLASLKYVQRIGNETATGSFEIVGESAASVKDTVDRVYSKVKELLASKHIDFGGEVDVTFESLVEFDGNTKTPSKCLVLNLTELAKATNGEEASLLDPVPLDDDSEIVRVLRSSRVGTGRPFLTTKEDVPHAG